MGSKHFGDAQEDRQQILNVIGAALLLGEGVTFVSPPANSPASAKTSTVHWGQEAFAGERTSLMADGRVVAQTFTPDVYRAVLQVVREYRIANATSGDLEDPFPNDALAEALDRLVDVLGAEDDDG